MDGSDLMDELTCGVCMEMMRPPPDLRAPKSLHCAHTFCLKCLTDIQADDAITCPICRVCTPTSADKLPSNSMLIRLIDKLKITFNNGPICENCGDENRLVIGRCLECCINFCQPCYNAHQIIKTFNTHKFYSLDDLDKIQSLPKNPINTYPQCKKHIHENLNLFCETCSIFICRDCIIFDHPKESHTLMFISDAYEKYTKSISDELVEVKLTLDTLSNLILNAQATIQDTQNKYQQLCTDSREYFDEILPALHDYLDSRPEELIHSLETEFFAPRIDLLEMYKNNVNKAVLELQCVYNEALENGTAVDIITNRIKLIKSLQTYQNIQNELQPLPIIDTLQFQYNSSIIDHIKRLIIDI
eukprot:gene11634-24360_t